MIGRTNTGGGGGGGLNFRVVGGTSAPIAPKENDIWVNTGTKITSWCFSAEEPNFYEVKVTDSMWVMTVDSQINDGDIFNFIIPKSVSDYYGGLTIKDKTGKAFYPHNEDGSPVTSWEKGTKVGAIASRDNLIVKTMGSHYHEDCMVWITTGASSPVAFDALKKNSIEVYPLSAKHHIGGAWESVEAKSYQNGEWVGWYNGTLYDGNWYAGFEFVAFPKGQVSGETGTVTIDNDSDPVTVIARAGHGAYIADVDVTDYNTLEVCYELSGSNGWINFGFATDLEWRDNKSTGFVAVKSHQWTNVAKTTQTLDISALSGKYPFKLNMYNSTFTMWSLRMLK